MSKENMLPAAESTDRSRRSPTKHDEDEDEDDDIDFNPFLKETLSPEASSSLSSEIEGLDDGSVCNGAKTFHTEAVITSPLTCEMPSYTLGDSEHAQEENLVHTTASQAEVCEERGRLLEASCQTESANFQEKEHATKNSDVDGVFVNEVAISGKLSDDDEDAISKRTRARYSLASFTLDELESFLQETDDDEDLQNVDDEEEYRKFLAAVLLGEDGDNPTAQELGNIDDEDEDNDVDFEIELEEALDSDLDDRKRDDNLKLPGDRSRRRPETRQDRRRKTFSGNKKKLLEQSKRPLRPLLPLVPIEPNMPVPTPNGRLLANDVAVDRGYICGFTPHQIGQLYCLIHEHVQLLIQIYSLCIPDPSRQEIASQVQELILEILHTRDKILAWRNVPYPADLFRAPYLIPSVSDGSPGLHREHCIMEPFMNNARGVTSASNRIEAAGDACAPNRQPEHICSGPAGSSWTSGGFQWMPTINGPISSILDVAPLNLVQNYMNDMSNAIQEHKRRRIESSIDILAEREPLFLLPGFSYAAEVNGEGNRGEFPTDANKGPSSSNQPPKRSMAAALVETTKKRSIALVPKEVAKLAQMFFPLFNRALFPHKPPPVSATNRVLFTDTEDELLALGMMEYNTDWKAIQERFLPCKSKHQIFVRQKNRCSSKAPENPIKAVRRMKTSPLTIEEIRYIQEGLKHYKLDWMSVWKFIVPHRDPSLLPRQWRAAIGIQKSYKQNAARKAKRRTYEAERRRRKAADPVSWSPESEKEDCGSGDDCVDDPEEAYVHEAFLADWQPGTSGPMAAPPQSTHSTGPLNNQIVGEAQCHVGNIRQYITQTNPLRPFAASHLSVNQVDNSNPRTDGEHLVKLAPNLPAVNLPRNVRVLSRSAYRTHQDVNIGPIRETRGTHVPENSSVVGERSVGVGEDRFNSSGLQMHPLLFQAPVDGPLAYHPSNCTSSTSGSFSFFPGNRPQLNLSLFRSPNQMIHNPNSLNRNVTQDVNSQCSGIEFHPLLQRSDDVESNLQSSVPGQLASGGCPQSPLDLDIHLSSTSRKAQNLQSRNNENLGVTVVNQENSSLSCPLLENLPPVKGSTSRGSQDLVHGIERTYVALVDDESHPGIVMEQEELSDSEEEFEEQVEFECEEMTDSEEEENVSGADLVAELSHKDAPNLPLEKVLIKPQDERDHTGPIHSGPDASTAAGNIPSPSFKLGLTTQPMDTASSKSWLSLVSSRSESSGVNDHAPPRLNRSCRKRKEPAKAGADPALAPSIRKSRKQPSRNKKGSIR